ncbi:MAG: CoB--CoM heterodisulfide reductase iron-sulfur subunit A family protein, partial [Dehalococcoidia bacterium]
RKKEYPPERNVAGEEPKIGVFICHCGTNIAGVVSVPKVVKYAKGLENVVHAEDTVFACSVDSARHITETIKEKGLNRVVIAACTPRTHEPVFQETLKEAGLNPFLLEMANIREHCSWVHMNDKNSATLKAQELVRMALAKAKLIRPLYRISLGLNHTALVIGGGVSGMASALSLAEQGFEVNLIEKEIALGGMARRISYTLEGEDVQTYLQNLIKRVSENPLIHVHTGAKVADTYGYLGNFKSKVLGADNQVKEIEHGVVIIANGAKEFKTSEYLYGKDPRVLTQLELEEAIVQRNEKVTGAKSVVMIGCVGSRDQERPYCSRVCCSQAIKNALKLKEMNPQMEVYVIHRDIRTYGLKEDYYREASEREVKFIRFNAEDKPEVEVVNNEDGKEVLRVTVADRLLGKHLAIDADILALGMATVASPDNKELSQLFKVPVNEDKFFLEAHMKLRPVEFATDGVFLCGLAHSPKTIGESIAQAQAAASRAVTVLSRSEIEAGGAISFVNKKKCAGCGVCELVCPFHAVQVDDKEKVAVVNSALCKGCGVCASTCRSGAIDIEGFSDAETLAVIQAV